MRETGCCKINYAPESGSEATLIRIKKRVKLGRMCASMRAAVKVGIITRAHLIVGLPGQTWGEILDDFAFAARLAFLGLHDIAVFGFVPYPGSELYRQLVAEGRIVRDHQYSVFLAFNITSSMARMRSWSQHLRDWHIPFLILAMLAVFYALQFLMRPHRLLVSLYRILARKALTSFEIILTGMLTDWLTGRKRPRGNLGPFADEARNVVVRARAALPHQPR
jgi:radical SAM superfamily enzyme YgiQ (UPF0313 family)